MVSPPSSLLHWMFGGKCLCSTLLLSLIISFSWEGSQWLSNAFFGFRICFPHFESSNWGFEFFLPQLVSCVFLLVAPKRISQGSIELCWLMGFGSYLTHVSCAADTTWWTHDFLVCRKGIWFVLSLVTHCLLYENKYLTNKNCVFFVKFTIFLQANSLSSLN